MHMCQYIRDYIVSIIPAVKAIANRMNLHHQFMSWVICHVSSKSEHICFGNKTINHDM